jgi:hypothetical protein
LACDTACVAFDRCALIPLNGSKGKKMLQIEGLYIQEVMLVVEQVGRISPAEGLFRTIPTDGPD